MGEIADMMYEGTLCMTCGVYVGDERGIPVICKLCAKDPGNKRLIDKGDAELAIEDKRW